MAQETVMKPAFQTHVDATTKIKTSGQYTNLIVKDYPKREEVGLAPGEFLTVTKDPQYAEPYTKEKSFGSGDRAWTSNMHMFTVFVGDQKASFISFSDAEAKEFTEAGGVGETIQIGCEEFNYVNKKGQKMIDTRLRFRRAE